MTPYTLCTQVVRPGLKGSSLFLVKDLDSIGGLLHRRSTLDLGSVIIMAHDPGAVVKCFRAQFNVITLDPCGSEGFVMMYPSASQICLL